MWDDEAELQALMAQKQREEDAEPYNQQLALRNKTETRSRLIAREVARRSLGRKGGDQDALGFMLPSSTSPGEEDGDRSARQEVADVQAEPEGDTHQGDQQVQIEVAPAAASEVLPPKKRLTWDERYATKSRRAKRHMRFGRKKQLRKTQEAAKAAAHGAKDLA